jgi:4-amino-4-deoxy-L-arabinose transferase-like glycosyltransferase
LPLVAFAIVAGVAAIVVNRLNVRVGFLVAGALLGVAVLARPIVQFIPFLIALLFDREMEKRS